MLLPGVRLIERPGILHFFDGRRVVSLRGDEAAREAVLRAAGARGAPAVRGTDAEVDAGDLLVRLGLAAHGESTDLPWAAAYALSVTGDPITPAEVAARLERTTVHVWDDGTELAGTLAESGLRVVPLRDPAQLAALDPAHAVAVVRDADGAPGRRLGEANDRCLQNALPWLPIGAFDGALLRIGPLVVPGHTACVRCLERRLAANVAYGELFSDIRSAAAVPAPVAVRRWADGIVALVLARWVALRDPLLPGRLFTVVPEDFEVRAATVYRVPRCPSCAAPDYVPAAAPWAMSRDH